MLVFYNSTILDNTITKSFLLSKLSKYIYNKAQLLLLLNRTTRSFKITDCFNYKDLNCRNKSKNYIYIIYILCALFINYSLDLSSVKVSKTLDLLITKL